MNNQEILGMDSANAAAKEMPYGSNMTISAALVIEMVERITDLENALKNLLEATDGVYSNSRELAHAECAAQEALKKPNL
jgi:hypothetical protein